MKFTHIMYMNMDTRRRAWMHPLLSSCSLCNVININTCHLWSTKLQLDARCGKGESDQEIEITSYGLWNRWHLREYFWRTKNTVWILNWKRLLSPEPYKILTSRKGYKSYQNLPRTLTPPEPHRILTSRKGYQSCQNLPITPILSLKPHTIIIDM